MIEHIPPGLPLLIGALLIPFLRGRARSVWTVLLPLLGLIHIILLEPGNYHQLQLFGYPLTLVRVDKLSLAFGYIFHICAILSAVYAFHLRDTSQHVAGMMYVGSAIGGVFAGDLISLFIYWEITAITSVFLIWARHTDESYRAGIRYLVVQVGSGVLLLVGVILYTGATGSLAFGKLIGADGRLATAAPGVFLIFLAFGIKSAFPFLHNWLQDSYPKGTVTGTVFLSAFTTKLAIYALARGFPGTGILVPIGLTMTLFPVFYAVIENDLRKVLAYSLNNQLGFMVVGVGIGTAMSVDGTVAHAFCHILYKALLFMSMGAILYRTGTTKVTELGGLYKSMPFTTVFCIVGAASIAAFPLFSGFVSKSLILTAVADEHRVFIFIGLLIASAGVMEHSGIKIPFFGFFGHDSGIRVKEAPLNMLLAMGTTAALCILLGIFPAPLYKLLPSGGVGYQPYTAGHVVTQFQLLLFAALAFGVLLKTKVYPAEIPSLNLDFDWTYRRLLPAAARLTLRLIERMREILGGFVGNLLCLAHDGIYRLHGPEGVFARTWPTGAIVFWAVLGLGAYLLLYFLS